MKKKQIIKQIKADIKELKELAKLKHAYENELSLLNFKQSLLQKEKQTLN